MPLYLVTVGRPQRRERLSDLFWDAGDDRRASLRWSLSRLRPALDDAETRRIIASGEKLAFQAAGAWVDVEVLRAALARGLSALAAVVHELRECWRSLQPSDAPAAAPTAGAV